MRPRDDAAAATPRREDLLMRSFAARTGRTVDVVAAARLAVVVLATAAALGGCVGATKRRGDDDGKRERAGRSTELGPSSTGFSQDPTTRRLVILHMGDGESDVVGENGAGGVARAAAVLDALRAKAGAPTITVLAGDTIIPSPELGLEVAGKNAVAVGYAFLGAQASAVGNHEFDLGETFLADYVKASAFPFVTATLDVRGGPLDSVDAKPMEMAQGSPWLERAAGRLLPRGKLCGVPLVDTPDGARCDGVVVGVIGATTETLRLVSRLSADVVVPDGLDGVRDAIQREVEALRKEKIDVVVLLSHMQDVQRDLALIERGLRGIDVIVSGGGDDHLADDGDRLLPGHARADACRGERSCFPIVRRAVDGRAVLVVATGGGFGYVGRLEVGFDADGDLSELAESFSKPFPVDDVTLAELGATPTAAALAYEKTIVAELAPLATPFATTTRWLEGAREQVRNRETNLGNLSADAIAWAARDAGGPEPAFALRNGGGIRAPIGSVHPTTFVRGGGELRPIDLKTSFRFDSPIVVVTTTHAALKQTLESALRGAGTGRGHFPQASREVFLEYTKAAPEQTHATKDGRVEEVLCPGARVRTLTVTDATGATTPIVVDGKLATPQATITFATLDYLAKGGDGWFPSGPPTRTTPVVRSGAPATEQSVVRDYVLRLERDGLWRGGDAYVDPAPGVPSTFTRIRETAVTRTDDIPKGCAAP